MPKRNFGFEKRQKEEARKKKQAEKAERKREAREAENAATVNPPVATDEASEAK